MVQIGDSWADDEVMSAEDMATLDGIWKTSSGDLVEDEAVNALAVPVRPEIPDVRPQAEEPGPDLEAAKAMLAEEDGAGVFPWRTASREQIARQWQGLREFVDWMVVTYLFRIGSDHKPCWWRHPNIVQEWVSLRHLYDLSWSEEDSGSGPNNFHYWLQASRARLASAWSEYNECDSWTHAEPRAQGGVPTVIEDDEWEALTGGEQPYRPPEQWPTRSEVLEAPGEEESAPQDG
ncbi:hypothetical protein GCM10028787_31200 [Brachybacterium horti]